MPVAPPRPKGPPLTALRAFEAAARLGGFSAAALELGVTPGAVASHVKALEDELATALFERHARGVRLTAVGERVLPSFITAFDALGVAIQSMRTEAAPKDIHIATLPAIAELWLAPRLSLIRSQLPDARISVTALENPPDLKRIPFDLSLFFEAPGRTRHIGPDIIFPVCSPALALRLKRPRDLADLPCLTDSAWASDWSDWLKVAQPGLSISPSGPVFSLYSLAVREVLEGAGVLMGHQHLVEAHLLTGALVAPFRERVTLPRVLTLRTLKPARPGSMIALAAELLLKS